MSDDTDKLDLLRIAGLRRKKKAGADGKYASFNRRMMAATIDSVIWMFFLPLVDWVAPINTESLQASVPDQGDPLVMRLWLMDILNNRAFVTSWIDNFLAQLLLIGIYSAVFWHFWATTPGKALLRMKIVDAKSERPISDGQIALRLGGYVISAFFFFLGFLWIGIDKRKQGWHDKLADTVVVLVPRKKDAATLP